MAAPDYEPCFKPDDESPVAGYFCGVVTVRFYSPDQSGWLLQDLTNTQARKLKAQLTAALAEAEATDGGE